MPTSLEFDEFVRVRSHRLLRLAYACTRDHALAEDLLQTALARTWPVWQRIDGDPEPYVRRALMNAHNSWWRRRWTAEDPTDVLPERGTRHPQCSVDERDAIRRPLARLPRQQRSVLVLRYFADLSEVEIAEAMGVTPGAVKGYASKGLAKLRLDPTLLAEFAPEPMPEGTERVTAVRERIRQRSRNRLIAAGTAVVVVLAVVGGVLAGERLRKTPNPHPVQPSPSPSLLQTSGVYFSGQRLVLDARDIPLAQRRHSLTFTPLAGKHYWLATECAHLSTETSPLIAEVRLAPSTVARIHYTARMSLRGLRIAALLLGLAAFGLRLLIIFWWRPWTWNWDEPIPGGVVPSASP